MIEHLFPERGGAWECPDPCSHECVKVGVLLGTHSRPGTVLSM